MNLSYFGTTEIFNYSGDVIAFGLDSSMKFFADFNLTLNSLTLKYGYTVLNKLFIFNYRTLCVKLIDICANNELTNARNFLLYYLHRSDEKAVLFAYFVDYYVSFLSNGVNLGIEVLTSPKYMDRADLLNCYKWEFTFLISQAEFDYFNKNYTVMGIAILEPALSSGFFFYEVAACNLMFLCIVFLLIFSIFLTTFLNNTQDSTNSFIIFLNSFFIDSEKEVIAMDDFMKSYVVIAVSFLFFFGFFFNENSFSLFFLFFPFLFIYFFFLPFNLLLDFGLLCSLYIKGVASSKTMFIECLFDYINNIAFILRLIIQFIRLVIIFIVYITMHDAIFFNASFFDNWYIRSLYNCCIGVKSHFLDILIMFLFKIFLHMLNVVYELIHFFFLATVQFYAFFIIAFWLYLLLYTFYILESFELLFFTIRLKMKKNKQYSKLSHIYIKCNSYKKTLLKKYI